MLVSCSAPEKLGSGPALRLPQKKNSNRELKVEAHSGFLEQLDGEVKAVRSGGVSSSEGDVGAESYLAGAISSSSRVSPGIRAA